MTGTRTGPFAASRTKSLVADLALQDVRQRRGEGDTLSAEHLTTLPEDAR